MENPGCENRAARFAQARASRRVADERGQVERAPAGAPHDRLGAVKPSLTQRFD